MRYMLDTNICIFLIKKKEQSVLSAFDLKKAEGIAISTIVLAELEYGVCHSDAYSKNMLNLLSFLTTVEILDFDSLAAVVYGQIRERLYEKGTPIGNMDMLIAAHAQSLGLTLVTNNTREYERVENLTIEDWL